MLSRSWSSDSNLRFRSSVISSFAVSNSVLVKTMVMDKAARAITIHCSVSCIRPSCFLQQSKISAYIDSEIKLR